MDYITVLREHYERELPNVKPQPLTLRIEQIGELLQQIDQMGAMRVTAVIGDYALTTDGRLFRLSGKEMYLCKPYIAPVEPAPAEADDWEAA
jgi:hypothetical protein